MGLFPINPIYCLLFLFFEKQNLSFFCNPDGFKCYCRCEIMA